MEQKTIKFQKRYTKMFQKTWYMIGRAAVNYYVRHILRADIQHEYPLPDGPKIIAVNHPSTSDPAYVTALFKEQTSILILETLFKVPVFGRSLRMAGHIPVVPGSGRDALEEATRLLKAGRTVIIFPEGVISPAAGMHKGHTGVARLALSTGAPVVPVGISLDPAQIRMVQTKVEGKMEPGAWYLHGPYAMTVGTPSTYHGDANDHEQVRGVTGQIMQGIAVLKQRGEHRLDITQRECEIRTARRGMVARAAHWAAYSVAFRAVRSMVMFLIAGRA